jgi:hypothetical protein
MSLISGSSDVGRSMTSDCKSTTSKELVYVLISNSNKSAKAKNRICDFTADFVEHLSPVGRLTAVPSIRSLAIKSCFFSVTIITSMPYSRNVRQFFSRRGRTLYSVVDSATPDVYGLPVWMTGRKTRKLSTKHRSESSNYSPTEGRRRSVR